MRGDRVKFDGVRMRQRLNGERAADGEGEVHPSVPVDPAKWVSNFSSRAETTEPKFAMILALAEGG